MARSLPALPAPPGEHVTAPNSQAPPQPQPWLMGSDLDPEPKAAIHTQQEGRELGHSGALS